MMNEQALKERLHAVAKEKGIPFNACWKQLLLERFLTRLAKSQHTNKLIFKGGFLLAYLLKIGRETVDLDFLLTRMKAEEANLQKIAEEIAAIALDDGFLFSFHSISLLSQPQMDYPGYRIVLDARFAKMKDRIHVDIGVGDIVEPQNQNIRLFHYREKPFFEDAISLLVYHIETIFAEKLETAISKGTKNTRMKDYHDLFLLRRDARLQDPQSLRKSVFKTFENRETPLELIRFDQAGLEALQKLWTAHLAGLGLFAKELELPREIQSVIEELNSAIVSLIDAPVTTQNELTT